MLHGVSAVSTSSRCHRHRAMVIEGLMKWKGNQSEAEEVPLVKLGAPVMAE